MLIGRVSALWRYPVKSMLGETTTYLDIDRRGVVADRQFAIRNANGKFGSGKSTRRFRRIDGLLGFTATYDGDVNHTGSADTQTFSIARARATLTVSGYDGSYDGDAHAASGFRASTSRFVAS